MRILIVHNRYKQRGGEDTVVEGETRLLEKRGHEVRQWIVSNEDLSPREVLAVAWNAPYSRGSKRAMAEQIAAFRPDVVHVHNIFPILTPSIYDACIEAGVPVVQTLHNYRLICPKATLYRDGKVCELCVHGSPYQAVLHACYRDSRLQSLVPARMLAAARRNHTWATKVTRYIALTAFARDKIVEGGVPAELIDLKPNFDEGGIAELDPASEAKRAGAIFVGRFSEDKGVRVLFDAWLGQGQGLDVPIRVVGDGPLMAEVRPRATPAMTLLGFVPPERVRAEMLKASFMLMPSLWYEGMPMVITSAYALGLPVIGSRIGAIAELVEDGVTGLHVTPGDPDDLADKVRWAHEHPAEMRKMGRQAQEVYQRRFSAEVNYPQLMAIYDKATAAVKRGRSVAAAD
jgi:glycosyltransferase involved in cell wall biosynthesis